MVWTFQCPMNDCELSSEDNDQERVIENAQQHMRDAHSETLERQSRSKPCLVPLGKTPTRADVEQYVTGPG